MKFEVGTVVKHVKSGGLYLILGTPDQYRIESTNEPAYVYRSTHGDAYNNPIWIRSKKEMEDGRFTFNLN